MLKKFDWSGIKSKDKDVLIFFPFTIQVSLHEQFKTRKLMTCLDPEYRIVVQCQNIAMH